MKLLPTLKEYDEIEGIGESWYSREKVEATLYDGTKVEAWVYCHKTSRGGEPIPSGCWSIPECWV